MTSRNEIHKSILLDAPLERVWQAVSDAGKFGEWFGAEFDGPFEAGRTLSARIRPTRVDPEVAKLQEAHTGMPFKFRVLEVQAPRLIVFGWHPFATDVRKDYSGEAMTTIELKLDERADGTCLAVTESGFDAIPAERRDEAYAANEGGWMHQLKLVEKFVVTPF